VLAASDAARLTEFSRAFKAAARAVVLYPDAHPAITATLGRLAHLTSSAQLPRPLRISVTADSLLVGGQGVTRPDAAIGELAALLHAHLIGEITINPDGDAAAWRSLLLLIARPPEDVRSEGGIVRLWMTMAGRHVELRQIDYAEVLRERQAGNAASWQRIVDTCLAGDRLEIPQELLEALVDGTTTSDELAGVLGQFEAPGDASGPGLTARTAALVRLLRGIVRAVAERAPEQSERVMRNLAVALGRLSPDTILSLVARGAAPDGDDAPIVGPLVSRMPDATVAAFVARHANARGAALERVAQAFQALVVDRDRRERLVAMAHESSPAGGDGEGFEQQWREVVETLLTQYSDEPYVSDEYARELGTARMQAVEIERVSDDPPERLAAWLGTVATSELRRLDVALMLDLLRIERDPDRRERLMGPVVSVLDDLFRVGDFEAAEAILAALRNEDDAANRDAAAARATLAHATIARLVNGSTMQRIVGHLATIDDAQFHRARAMCLSFGDAMVRPLAEALAVEERTRTRERLTEILIGFGASGRREVEQLKSSANPAVRRTAIYLLREFGGSEALPELTELLDDAEPGVQREAVHAILKIGTDRGYEVLQQALVSGTPRSREAIMLALGSNREDRSAPLLVYILEHVPHTGELGWVYAKALDLLGQVRDPDSVPALRTALYRGEWWAPRRTRALRSAAAAALARIATAEAIEVLSDAAREGSRGVRAAARAHIEHAGRGRGAGGR
jgi:HEAT repeat protein